MNTLKAKGYTEHLEHPTLPEALYQIGGMWLPTSDKMAFLARLSEADAEGRKAILKEAKQMVITSAKNLDALMNAMG
jgi:hypothetical protein